MVVGGVTVEYRDAEGAIGGSQAGVVDFDDAASNDRVAVKHFTIVENRRGGSPDVVLFVNDVPLAVIEREDPTGENATIQSAFRQLQTCKREIPALFAFNAALVVSDRFDGCVGTLIAG